MDPDRLDIDTETRALVNLAELNAPSLTGAALADLARHPINHVAAVAATEQRRRAIAEDRAYTLALDSARETRERRRTDDYDDGVIADDDH